jgi:hypothetical protein
MSPITYYKYHKIALFLVAIAMAVSFGSSHAFGYPGFVGYGYTSCAACHYNTLGNGPLTDYGRAVSASAVSGRVFLPSSVTDEDLAKYSGAMGAFQPFKWLRPSLDYRMLRMTTGFATSASRTRSMLMQLDGNLILKFGSRDQLVMSGTFGYTPDVTKRRTPFDDAPLIAISREHYISYMPLRGFRAYVGKMDKAYGLRIADHEAFARKRTRNAQNDQTHGALLHLFQKKYEVALHGFIGDYLETAGNRLKGYSATAEYEPLKLWRVGASFMEARNSFTRLRAQALHSKLGAGKGMSLLTELGLVRKMPRAGSQSVTNAFYGLGQLQLRLFRGMHFLWTTEYLNSDIKTAAEKQIRFTPALQYFPIQRLEVRLDLMNSRTISPTAVTPDSWTLMNQVHVSL